jgi:Flp pilus assembly pilin Flp
VRSRRPPFRRRCCEECEDVLRSTPLSSIVAVAALKRLVNARLRREEEGQDLLEYGLLCALIALFALGAVTTVGQTINNVFWEAIASNF